jgi:hypothetical protein
MKKYLFIGIIIILMSCGNHRTENKAENKEGIAKALQDNKSVVSSLKQYRGSNIIDELFEEAMSNDSLLKNLNDQIEKHSQASNELFVSFDKYNGKSQNYYEVALSSSNSIKDSLIRQNLVKLINESQAKYKSKVLVFNSLTGQINKNLTSINDLYTVLKVFKTMPMIEEYQNKNIPDKSAYLIEIKQERKTINKIKDLEK